ncbi:MAG: glycosyl transferase family 2, partial [Acidobacteriota bacterium]
LPWRVRAEAIFHMTENFAYLFLIALTILIWPAIRARQQIDSGLWVYADLPILAIAWLSVLVFYYVSQRRTGRGRLESLAAIPPLMSLGIGLAVNNGAAVLEALLGTGGGFVRTPKDGPVARGSRPAAPLYRNPLGPHPIIEACFAVYLAAALVDVAHHGQWFWVPFLLLFLVGYAATSLSSLFDVLQARRLALATH